MDNYRLFRPWEEQPTSKSQDSLLQEDSSRDEGLLEIEGIHENEPEAVPSGVKRKHVDLQSAYSYLTQNNYPSQNMTSKQQSNFRMQCKPFFIMNHKLYYRRNDKSSSQDLKVIFSEQQRHKMIKVLHEGAGSSEEAKALSSHRGRDSTYKLLRDQAYWPGMSNDVRTYILECLVCQKVNPATLRVIPKLHSVAVPAKVMKQIGLDLIQLPEANGFKYAVVAIDYFSKWSEARAIPDKCAITVARFIYEDIICRHGCPSIQINDQGKEFVNRVSMELHRMTGVNQRITSAYHPQANGLVERQNRTIKNFLLKSLEKRISSWPDALQGVLFSHRTAPHKSTGHSPFYILYQREPVLPIDVDVMEKDQHSEMDEDEAEELPFDKENFNKVLNSMIEIRKVLQDEVKQNINKAQKEQRRVYNKRHSHGITFKGGGDKVLVKNLRRNDRKGGWSTMPWIGPYCIAEIHANKTVSLVSLKENKILKIKQHMKNLKLFHERKTEEYGDEDEDEYKMDYEILDEDCSEKSGTTGHTQRYFYPVDKVWQERQCDNLNLKLIHIRPSAQAPTSLEKPHVTEDTLGDGNCWFRFLSMCITGDQNAHLDMRQKLLLFMKQNKQSMSLIENVKDFDDYLIKTNMDKDRTWATEAEIYASAIFLNTDIFVFNNQRKQWQQFCKTGQLTSTSNNAQRSLYAMNVDNNHFVVVCNVK